MQHSDSTSIRKGFSVMRNIQLSQNQFTWLIVLIVWQLLTYMLPNKIILFEPRPVPLSMVDDMIPMSSWWIWFYVSYYIFIFGTFLFLKFEKTKKLLFMSYTSSALFSCFCFFLFPTSIDRELYPIGEIKGLSDWALNFIRSTDTSVNCLPSMHIALSLTATLCIYSESRKYGLLAFIWFSLISYSTMATKQHYFYDFVAGVVLAVVFWIFSKFVCDRYITETRSE
jgi:membrane-associated phospholipid phosphatase